MKKKIITIIASILLAFGLVACNKDINKRERHAFSAMGTTIELEIYDKDNEAFDGVEDIYNFYSQLTTNYRRNEVTADSPYYNYENIYTINQNAGIEPVEVKEELIELIEYSLELHEDTLGYFNIGIGKVVETWKELISNNIFVTKQKYLETIDLVRSYEEIDLNKIIIDKENKTVYLEDDSISLDLGAVAKGYVTQVAYDYLLDRGVKRFKIFAGGSAISVGLHKEKRKFRFGIADDNKIFQDNLIGIVSMENKHLATSGSENQFVPVKDENQKTYAKIHHIISPYTLVPENIYYKIALIGDDAGLLDAYSTAVYLMNKEEAIHFLGGVGIGYILYLDNLEVVTNLDEDTFLQYGIISRNANHVYQ